MSTSKIKALFNGCSVTVGAGFPEELRDQYVYDRLVCNHFDFDRTSIAVGGSSNYETFMKTCDALISKKYDVIFNQWSPLNRLTLRPGPGVMLPISGEDLRLDDFKYRDLWINKKEYAKLQNILTILNHDYHNIIDLVRFCNIIDSISKLTGVPVVYINGSVMWSDDLTKPLSADLNMSLSEYTKIILDFDNRDDNEIVCYFTELQKKFETLDQSKWVNLFNSVRSLIVDSGPLGHHPGVKTYQILADQIIDYVNTNLGNLINLPTNDMAL